MSLKSSAEGPHSKSEVCRVSSAANKRRYLDRDGLDNEWELDSAWKCVMLSTKVSSRFIRRIVKERWESNGSETFVRRWDSSSPNEAV
jgi:hypothetical protein